MFNRKEYLRGAVAMVYYWDKMQNVCTAKLMGLLPATKKILLNRANPPRDWVLLREQDVTHSCTASSNVPGGTTNQHCGEPTSNSLHCLNFVRNALQHLKVRSRLHRRSFSCWCFQPRAEGSPQGVTVEGTSTIIGSCYSAMDSFGLFVVPSLAHRYLIWASASFS